MKPQLFFSLFLFVSVMIGTAQEPWHFNDDDTKYTEMYFFAPIMGYDADIDYYEYWIKGDTVINGNDYQLLYTRDIGRWKNGEIEYSNKDYILIGGLRRDSLDRVYFYRTIYGPQLTQNISRVGPFTVNEDNLIYDFRVQPGDTLSWKRFPNVVAEVDTYAIVDGKPLRTISFDFGGLPPYEFIRGDFWYEDRGSMSGLFIVNGWQNSGPGPVHIVNCITNRTTMEVINGFHSSSSIGNRFGIECEELITSAKEAQRYQSIQIFPNPTQNQIYIELDSQLDWESIQLFDLKGALLYETDMGDSVDERNRINLQSIVPSSGLYFVVLKTKDGQLFRQSVVLQP